jgi:DNA-directed RNA polymerase specialized sigma24 family protein
MTKTELRRYRALRRNADRAAARYDAIKAEMTRATYQVQSVPGGRKHSDRLGDAYAELDVWARARAGWLAESLDVLCRIEQAISSLPDEEHEVMAARYIDGLTWEAIAFSLHMSWGKVHYLHARALKRLAPL